jgi:hypothetical protein
MFVLVDWIFSSLTGGHLSPTVSTGLVADRQPESLVSRRPFLLQLSLGLQRTDRQKFKPPRRRYAQCGRPLSTRVCISYVRYVVALLL